jgi:steroid 5-alpha reductase family enzyme
MALWLTHYGYRSVVYPLRVRGERKQMTLLAAALAVVFNVVNGSANAYGVTRAASHLDTAWLADPRFAAGLVLFFAGMTMHLHSDAILRGLRAPGETGYRIPHGGLFRWVSCPNYLGEWIQWCGFALAAWTPAAAAFAFFTFANLAPRARAHHHWYRREFPEYPSDRRALVPGVW